MEDPRAAAARHDPRNLIGDALAMPELTPEEHRAIFFDWVFGLKEADPREAAAALLAAHAPPEDHPMRALLKEAAEATPQSGRRRRGRSERWRN